MANIDYTFAAPFLGPYAASKHAMEALRAYRTSPQLKKPSALYYKLEKYGIQA